MHTALWLLVGGYVYKLLPNTTTPRSRLYSLTHTHWYLWMSADFYQIQFHSRSFPPLLDNQHPVTMVIELSPEPYKYEGSRRWFLILGRVELNRMSLKFVSTNLLYLLFYFLCLYIYVKPSKRREWSVNFTLLPLRSLNLIFELNWVKTEIQGIFRFMCSVNEIRRHLKLEQLKKDDL